MSADKFNGNLLFFFCGFFYLFRLSRVCGNGFLLYLLRLIFLGGTLFFSIRFIDVLLRGFGGREIIAPLRPPAVLNVITDRNDVIVERVGLTMYDRNISIVTVFFDLEDGITAGCRFLVFGRFLLFLFLHSELILTEPEKMDESFSGLVLFSSEEVLRHRLPIPSLYRFCLAAEILLVVLSGQKVSDDLLCLLFRSTLQTDDHIGLVGSDRSVVAIRLRVEVFIQFTELRAGIDVVLLFQSLPVIDETIDRFVVPIQICRRLDFFFLHFLVAMQRCKAVLKAVVRASFGPFIAVPCRTRRKFLPFVIPSLFAPFAVDRGKVLHDVNDLLFFGPLPSCRS